MQLRSKFRSLKTFLKLVYKFSFEEASILYMPKQILPNSYDLYLKVGNGFPNNFFMIWFTRYCPC